MEERQRYFEEALSDFIHDAASGGAIRHLVDLGYSLDQIMENLSYPTPRAKVQKTAYRYMLESGLVRRTLPGMAEDAGNGEQKGEAPGRFSPVRFRSRDKDRIYQYLRDRIRENGAENVYLSCPFGMMIRQEEGEAGQARIRERLGFLNRREQDYILGIPWENRMMYHRLSSRMQEIGRKLIVRPELGCIYYFLKTGEAVSVEQSQAPGCL